MDEKLTVCALMAIYDEDLERISLSINSLIHQTAPLAQYVFIVDRPGRYDEISNLIKKLMTDDDFDNTTLVENNKNIGLAASLNRGLDHVRTRYVLRMDADDESDRFRVEAQLRRLLEKSEYTFCFCNTVDDGCERGYFGKGQPGFKDTFFGDMNYFRHGTLLSYSSILKELQYNPRWSCEDFDLYIRAAIRGEKFILEKRALYKVSKLAKVSYRSVRERRLAYASRTIDQFLILLSHAEYTFRWQGFWVKLLRLIKRIPKAILIVAYYKCVKQS